MKQFILYLTLVILSGCAATKQASQTNLPEWMKGKFTDDYGISYTINDSIFILEPSDKYHIIKWNKEEQYLLAKNGETNQTNKGLYTRIDYMSFKGMEPFNWGFCFTVYNAKDTTDVLQVASADRSIPRKGCNGYPFSRMKRKVE